MHAAKCSGAVVLRVRLHSGHVTCEKKLNTRQERRRRREAYSANYSLKDRDVFNVNRFIRSREQIKYTGNVEHTQGEHCYVSE